MALFDFSTTNIESYGSPENWSSWIKYTLGAVTGFVLGLIPAGWARRKAVTNAGELIQTDIELLKLNIDTQILSLRIYLIELNKNKIEAGQTISFDIWFLHRFDLVKSIDKPTLIKYYKRKFNQKESVGIVLELYQCFGTLETQMDKLNESYASFRIDAEKLVEEYTEALNQLHLEAIAERDRLSEEMYNKDTLTKRLFDYVFEEERHLNINNIIGYKESLHSEFKNEVYTLHTHKLYRPVLEFHIKGLTVIQKMENCRTLFANLVFVTQNTLKDAHKALYNEDYVSVDEQINKTVNRNA